MDCAIKQTSASSWCKMQCRSRDRSVNPECQVVDLARAVVAKRETQSQTKVRCLKAVARSRVVPHAKLTPVRESREAMPAVLGSQHVKVKASKVR